MHNKSAVSYNCWQDESVIKEKAETALRTGHRHGNEIVHNSEDVLPMCGSTSLTVICSLTLGRTWSCRCSFSAKAWWFQVFLLLRSCIRACSHGLASEICLEFSWLASHRYNASFLSPARTWTWTTTLKIGARNVPAPSTAGVPALLLKHKLIFRLRLKWLEINTWNKKGKTR